MVNKLALFLLSKRLHKLIHGVNTIKKWLTKSFASHFLFHYFLPEYFIF